MKNDLLPVSSSEGHGADDPFKLGDSPWFRFLRNRCRELNSEIVGGKE